MTNEQIAGGVLFLAFVVILGLWLKKKRKRAPSVGSGSGGPGNIKPPHNTELE